MESHYLYAVGPHTKEDNTSWSSTTHLAPLQEDPELSIVILVCLAVMTPAGVLGNMLVILSVATERRLRLAGNILIVNLAVADLVVSTVVNPFAILGIVEGKEYFDRHWTLCNFVGTSCLISCVCSLLTILAISFNRYISMVHHQLLPKLFTWRRTVFYSVGLWFCSAVIEFPNHVGWGKNWFDLKGMICVYDRTDSYSFTWFFIGTAILVPVCLVFFFYISIFIHVKNIRSAAFMKSDGRHDKKLAKEHKRNAQLARTLFVIFVVYVLCWGPYALVVVIDREDTFHRAVHGATVTLAHVSSSGANSLIYGVTNPQFRRAYRRLFSCQLDLAGRFQGSNTYLGPLKSRHDYDETSNVNGSVAFPLGSVTPSRSRANSQSQPTTHHHHLSPPPVQSHYRQTPSANL